ncbi:predicted protein [Chaetomium globosum CBS 148.51]|uniref:Putative gamma-glutamylcyclotransferase n=1 Tax=Chaetomium globosum (strain ATCC 6205 / CBS 148.51 / DSM 1962 / NBRC 6347 / NRRL 1970) TaxID=306901 RepID=Q2H7M0_CHAGB|nr:uncharacterized protein CHGG_05345 [Chaetomium globosum CBS 148.51]EAQ88726.1 predicted protein [Chaetomium globosum CBS 148.51]
MEESNEPCLGVDKPAPPPPPPPPPPPLPPAPLSQKPPTRKVAAVPNQPTIQAAPPSDGPNPPPFQPTYYFFYGTLTKPHILQGVLGLDSAPTPLHPAQIHHHELTAWGNYRMLIDSSNPEAVVDGYAYHVQFAEEAHKLGYYEPNAYVLTDCTIHFTDPSQGSSSSPPVVEGKTFKYAGDAAALREGRFDRVLWERQMGRPWPLRRQQGGTPE